MNSADHRIRSRSLGSRWRSPSYFVIVALFSSVIFSSLSISNQSFWIDEAVVGLLVRQPLLLEVFTGMADTKGAEMQIPFYIVYEWSWAQLFGTSELALRAANIPWIIVIFCSPLVFFRAYPLYAWVCLPVLALNPNLWSTADEAKGYSMLLAGAGLLFSCLIRQAADRKAFWNMPIWWQCLFALSLILLSGTHLLGVPWMASGLLAAFILSPVQKAQSIRGPLLIAGGTVAILTVLGGYYLWTLLQGAGPTPAGSGVLLNIAFSAYELMGFLGVGPDKVAVRESGPSALLPFIPYVLLYGLPVILVSTYGLAQFVRSASHRAIVATLALLAVPTLFVVGLGIFQDFRFLARHLLPWSLLLVGLWTLAVTSLLRIRRPAAIALGVLFLVALGFSSLQIRTNPRFAKDDYRSAAAMARAAHEQGHVVWWAASDVGSAYYGLETTRESDSSAVLYTSSMSTDDFASLPSPSLILVSKEDIYGSNGALRKFMEDNDYSVTQTFPAFRVWQPGHATPPLHDR